MVSQSDTAAHADEDCLCQGKVPADKRVDFEKRVLDPKTEKWRWKCYLRYHADCPTHGTKVTPDATGTEPDELQRD